MRWRFVQILHPSFCSHPPHPPLRGTFSPLFGGGEEFERQNGISRAASLRSRCQLGYNKSLSAVNGLLCDSATPLYVIAPLYTFTPSAKPWSSIAFWKPRFAMRRV